MWKSPDELCSATAATSYCAVEHADVNSYYESTTLEHAGHTLGQYYSTDLTMPRDIALYRVYEGVVKTSVRVVKQWTPMLSEIDSRSTSRYKRLVMEVQLVLTLNSIENAEDQF